VSNIHRRRLFFTTSNSQCRPPLVKASFPALKIIQDWDSRFSTDSVPKPGSRQLLLERYEGVESHTQSNIKEIYEQIGFPTVAYLAKDRLSASAAQDFHQIHLRFVSRTHKLLCFSCQASVRFLVLQCGRNVFLQLSKLRECLGIIKNPKEPAYHNTARVLFATQDTR
jgi:hypothetical protein